jgi:peptidyl-tRNA hydrolase
VIDYVLQRPSPQQEQAMVTAITAGLEVLPVFLRDGSEKAMHQLHTARLASETGV